MDLCQAVSMERSTYYYPASRLKRGRRPSSSVLFNGNWVSNESMLPRIRELLAHEFLDYGYIKVTKQLNQEGYVVNKKKIYRLMKSHNLLKQQRIKSVGKRNFIKFRKPQANKPLNYFEMDIKYIYIHQEARNAYLLSVIDVYSRKIVAHLFSRSIRKKHVIDLWQKLKADLPDFKSITVRSDNGSQFIANDVRAFFYYHGVYQEFTQVATPEDDGHIEAFHSILQREFLSRNEYTTFNEMKDAINRYMKCYNQERLHGSLNYKTPEKFIEQYYAKNFFKEGTDDKSILCLEASYFGGKTNLNNLNINSQLCQ